ncbi:DUF2567 domain-containing protein [Tsukamurella paurometabola]|uniref:DUF2567 domain-containing protein n=1 Tax=Tsukamurella paurometabola TaxID=2061 RepID=A0A3P8KK42_TSUPA|nr:DUF2567 domain-containing protein [Tsukamurella paurometabola]UEA83785.1 DUF2567 domain-containing protein [Tsukamurella paurometabola]VDR40928.1 Uncharacterised protein [Tsukamurella paurometabola]
MPVHTLPRTATDVVVPVVVGAVLGAAAALVWGTTAPGVRGVVLDSGQAVLRTDQFDNFFAATVVFVVVSAIGGLLTAVGLFRGARRTPRGVARTLGAAALGVLVAVVLGQAVVNARFTGPGAPGLDFTAAPSIRLDGANVLAPADHSGGVLGDLASWVLVLVWPGVAALTCVVLALVGRLPDDDVTAPVRGRDDDAVVMDTEQGTLSA